MNQPSTNNDFLTHVPSPTRDLLVQIVDHFRSVLRNNLVGIYLHGSLAMGCFNPLSSDIDFIVVVQEPLAIDAKKKIAAFSLELADKAPPNGLEFSVVLLVAAQQFMYPTAYELHYSKAWHERYRTGQVDFEAQGYDKDLAAHFTIIRHRGISLYGANIKTVFSEVPAKDYLASIADDLDESYQNVMSGADEGECSVPPYAVLNFCRVLAFIEQGSIISKLEGGKWGMEHLPQQYKPVIQEAIKKYTSADNVQPVDCMVLKQFASYAMTIINDANN